MEANKKKKIAAVIAVMRYLSGQSAPAKAFFTGVPGLVSAWALAGRRRIMTNNQLTQRHALSRRSAMITGGKNG